MGGLAQRAPATSLGLVGASLSISGVPPFNGFWSKLLVLIALFTAGYTLVGAVAAGTALLTLITFVQVQKKALFGPLPARLAARPGGARHDVGAGRSPSPCCASLTIALWPLGVGDIVDEAAQAVRAARRRGRPPSSATST